MVCCATPSSMHLLQSTNGEILLLNFYLLTHPSCKQCLTHKLQEPCILAEYLLTTAHSCGRSRIWWWWWWWWWWCVCGGGGRRSSRAKLGQIYCLLRRKLIIPNFFCQGMMPGPPPPITHPPPDACGIMPTASTFLGDIFQELSI